MTQTNPEPIAPVDHPSPLLKELLESASRPPPAKEWRRAEPRFGSPEFVPLELRRNRTTVLRVSLQDVDSKGLGVSSRVKLDPYECVELRIAGNDGPFEPFKVVHVTQTASGFRLGLSVDS